MSMKMNELVSPYREQDMLTEVNFLRFCKKNGLSLARSDLALFDGLGLISPPVRPPVGTEGSSAYYSPYQLYVFRRFFNRYKPTRQDVPGKAEREAVVDLYRRFEFLMALDELYESFAGAFYRSRHRLYAHWLKSNHGYTPESFTKIKSDYKKREILKQEVKDLKDDYRNALDTTRKKYRPRAKLLAQEHSYAEDDLLNLARDFMNEGSLNRNYTSLDQRMAYAKTLDAEALIKHEHPYRVSSRLLWLYSLVRSTQPSKYQVSSPTLSSELQGNQGTHCIYCHSPLTPRQVGQKTCGSKPCTMADSNATKRRNRAARIYPAR